MKLIVFSLLVFSLNSAHAMGDVKANFGEFVGRYVLTSCQTPLDSEDTVCALKDVKLSISDDGLGNEALILDMNLDSGDMKVHY